VVFAADTAGSDHGSHPPITGEPFPELEATLAHLNRCENQIALLTVGTGTEDRGLGSND
jgi:hypothetical protein